MRGRTTGYAVDPVGEYMIGVATSSGYRLRRGRDGYRVAAGHLVVLDPTAPHHGRPLAHEPWSARLLVLELADVVDAALARRFTALHRASASGVSSLELQTELIAFLDDLLGPPVERHPDRATVLRAAAQLHDNVARNVPLDELARTAGTSKFHLVRQF